MGGACKLLQVMRSTPVFWAYLPSKASDSAGFGPYHQYFRQ